MSGTKDDWIEPLEEQERDYRFELSRLLREVGPAVLDNWRTILTTGGQQTLHVKCGSCGKGTRATVDVMDVQQQRLILTFLQEQITADGTAEPGAAKLIHDRSQLSDEDLAAYIARLKAEIAADSPARKELGRLIDRLDEEQVATATERMREILGG